MCSVSCEANGAMLDCKAFSVISNESFKNNTYWTNIPSNGCGGSTLDLSQILPIIFIILVVLLVIFIIEYMREKR